MRYHYSHINLTQNFIRGKAKNLRVGCRCGDPKRNNNNGKVRANKAREDVLAVQTADYDPWGLDFGTATVSPSGGGGQPYENLQHRYLYNSKEKLTDLGLNLYEYGFRWHDPQLGRFVQVDPLAEKYASISGNSYVANNPLNAIDPDGRYIIFITGLRLWYGHSDQGINMRKGSYYGIFKTDVYKYWRTYGQDKNAFGRSVDLVEYYTQKYNDTKIGFTSGSSYWDSQAAQRMEEGKNKAIMFHNMVLSGEINLEPNETIKIISHSQGGAHAAGYAKQLQSYKKENGDPLYYVEIIEYITPHQTTDIFHPDGIKGIQYSHPNDAVAGDDSPWWMPNGGTKHGKINGIPYSSFFSGNIMGGKNQPAANGVLMWGHLGRKIILGEGTRNGHNVTDNDEFIKQGEISN